ncbi:VWA domain-containing protein [Comamonadaceae bacterium G21597-S1]|nr:VWA domain-containing protein [Comamonadaceae bacterium G21597-S1]
MAEDSALVPAAAAPADGRPRVDAPFHLLAGLAPVLWQPALVCSSGDTRLRLADLPLWEQALLAGHLPVAERDWGDAPACKALRGAITELDLCTLTHGSAAMARQVLGVMLWHLDRLVDRPAAQSRDAAIDHMVQAFRAEWATQRQDWEQVLALFKSLGDLAHLRWDVLQGKLNSRGWSEAKRIGAVLDAVPELARFIDTVGRARRSDDLPPAAEPRPHFDAPRRPMAVAITTELLDQPSEVRGVKRSGQLARMLASEAAMVRHPVLARLWRARFAEQQLLTYEDAALATQWRLQPDTRTPAPVAMPRAPVGQGPMLVCLDTSGSMRGAPENVAKACVLQALRTAQASGRACRLLAFGGAGELLEQELALTPQGLDTLLAVMDQNFDGGTDVQTPLERAVGLVQTGAFVLADILIVSDGEFGVTPATLDALRSSKKTLGLRVHGILVGDRETIGLLEVCDQIHWVRAWRRYATAADQAYADGFSPVHSRSLTAMYFPNAIRRDPGPPAAQD